jgi:hypothetical protein
MTGSGQRLLVTCGGFDRLYPQPMIGRNDRVIRVQFEFGPGLTRWPPPRAGEYQRKRQQKTLVS